MRKLTLYLFILVTIFGAFPCQSELPEDEAFNLQVRLLDKKTLELYWQIAPKHYLYKDQIALINANNMSLLQANTLPTGTTIEDPILGTYVVYSEQLLLSVPWHNNQANKTLILRYQGCMKDGFCYLPISKLLTITKNYAVQVQGTDLREFPEVSDSNQLATMIEDRFLPVTLIIFFFLGILLSFTPCVLPMIPIVVNLIVGPKNISTHKAFILASSYVLGMAGCYTVAGIIAGLLGATLQAWLQQPIVLISLSILLVLLALAQFDLIHIKLPHFNSKLHHWSQKQLQGSYFGAFILGILSALIVSPCITPPLIGALTYISQHGNPVIGGLALLSLGLGMGVPLIIVAMLSSMILPKAGEWMNAVKTFAGLALLGLAIWLLQRIIPTYAAIILWGTLCIIAAVIFKAFHPVTHARRSTKLLKLLGVMLAIFGAALIIHTSYIHFYVNKQSTATQLKWQNIDTVMEFEKALAVSKREKKHTIVEFYAYWCTSCKRIEATVFKNPEVIKQLEKFNLLRIDMTNMDPKQKELLSLLEIFGPPAILIFTPEGTEIKAKRTVGDINVNEMLILLSVSH